MRTPHKKLFFGPTKYQSPPYQQSEFHGILPRRSSSLTWLFSLSQCNKKKLKEEVKRQSKILFGTHTTQFSVFLIHIARCCYKKKFRKNFFFSFRFLCRFSVSNWEKFAANFSLQRPPHECQKWVESRPPEFVARFWQPKYELAQCPVWNSNF